MLHSAIFGKYFLTYKGLWIHIGGSFIFIFISACNEMTNVKRIISYVEY